MAHFRTLDIADLWSRRYLVGYLVLSELKARYKQTALGFAWAFIRPLILVVVFSFLFGAVAKLPTEGVPYVLFAFTGVLAWDLFSGIVTGSAGSILKNKPIVERIYCPRIVLPFVAVLLACFDVAITTALYVVLFLYYGFLPSTHAVFVPFIFVAIALCGFSIGVWLAAVAVWLHDVRYFVSYLLQLLMLLTPVGYAAAAVPAKFNALVLGNPMATLIELLRWALLGTSSPSATAVVLCLIILSSLLMFGVWFFVTLEKSFADVL